MLPIGLPTSLMETGNLCGIFAGIPGARVPHTETVQNLGVVGLGQRQAGRRERDAVAGGDRIDERRSSAVHAREVATGSDESAGSVVKPLGLTLADAKALLAAIQRHLVQAEVADYCRERRCCPRCQEQRPLKKDVRVGG